MNERFSFYAPAYLQKSGKGKKTYRIGGIITNENEDTQNEILLTKGLDLSYFEGGWGKIKYEHDSEISKEPDNIIGFPDIIKKNKNSISFEGDLIEFDENIPDSKLTPQQRTAKSAVGLLKAIELHNQKYPNNPQKIGYSVEGEYLQKDKKTGLVSKARITNVVLTTKPINTTTVAVLLKSLQVGHEVATEKQTGFGATRKESLEGNKNQFFKGEHQMNFGSLEEAKKYFLSEGMSEEEAAKKAAEVMEKKSQETPTNEVEKSINESLKKAISLSNSVIDLQPDIDSDNLGQKLQKSIKNMNKGDTMDISDYFLAKQEVDLSSLEVSAALVEKMDLLAKSFGALAEGALGLAKENTELKKSLLFITESQKLNNQALLKSLKSKADYTFAPSDELYNHEIVENVSTDTKDMELSKFNKSVVVNAMFDLYKEGKISDKAVSAYEGLGYIEDSIKPLIKSKINSMKK